MANRASEAMTKVSGFLSLSAFKSTGQAKGFSESDTVSFREAAASSVNPPPFPEQMVFRLFWNVFIYIVVERFPIFASFFQDIFRVSPL